MSYEVYKVLHLVSIFFFIAGLAITFMLSDNPKFNKIVTGITSLLILVAGMGLLARIGISMKELPTWVIPKMAIWLILAIAAPILGKRLQSKKTIALYGLLSLLSIAGVLAIYKPFAA